MDRLKRFSVIFAGLLGLSNFYFINSHQQTVQRSNLSDFGAFLNPKIMEPSQSYENLSVDAIPSFPLLNSNPFSTPVFDKGVIENREYLLSPTVVASPTKTITPTPQVFPTHTPTATPIIDYAKSSDESKSNISGLLSGSSLEAICDRENKFGAHLMIQDYGISKAEIDQQVGLAFEFVGRCGFVKGFDPYVKDDFGLWGYFASAVVDKGMIPIIRLGHGPAPKLAESKIFADYILKIYDSSILSSRDIPLIIELWNEPNLPEEWSGHPSSVEYANFFYLVASEVKQRNNLIKFMNGGLADTESSGKVIGNLDFIHQMFDNNPKLVDVIDIWASHPYPQNFEDCSPFKFNLVMKYCFNSFNLEYEVVSTYFVKNGKVPPKFFLSETSWRTNISSGQVQTIWGGLRDPIYSPDEFASAVEINFLKNPKVIGFTPFVFYTHNDRWVRYGLLNPDKSITPYYASLKNLQFSYAAASP